jgi:hypothetical protein
MEKFHKWVKYGQWNPITNGCPYTTTLSISTTLVVPLPVALLLSLIELMPKVVDAPLGTTILIVIET